MSDPVGQVFATQPTTIFTLMDTGVGTSYPGPLPVNGIIGADPATLLATWLDTLPYRGYVIEMRGLAANVQQFTFFMQWSDDPTRESAASGFTGGPNVEIEPNFTVAAGTDSATMRFYVRNRGRYLNIRTAGLGSGAVRMSIIGCFSDPAPDLANLTIPSMGMVAYSAPSVPLAAGANQDVQFIGGGPCSLSAGCTSIGTNAFRVLLSIRDFQGNANVYFSQGVPASGAGTFNGFGPVRINLPLGMHRLRISNNGAGAANFMASLAPDYAIAC